MDIAMGWTLLLLLVHEVGVRQAIGQRTQKSRDSLLDQACKGKHTSQIWGRLGFVLPTFGSCYGPNRWRYSPEDEQL